jgi:hypothetical protein
LVGSHADQSAGSATVIVPPRLGVAAPGAASFLNGIGPLADSTDGAALEAGCVAAAETAGAEVADGLDAGGAARQA